MSNTATLELCIEWQITAGAVTVDYGNSQRRADNRHPECEGTEARLSECLVPGPVICSSVGVTCQTESEDISVHYTSCIISLTYYIVYLVVTIPMAGAAQPTERQPPNQPDLLRRPCHGLYYLYQMTCQVSVCNIMF